MTREQLEHLIRAAGVIAEDDAIVVIGSQAILGQFPDAPEPMRVSMEADLFPLHHPERAEVIEGSIGDLSPFHETFGYYAQGVGEETAYLPQGWKERFVIIENENTRGVRGLCLEVHDLLVAKVVAGREKDVDFLAQAAKHHMADLQTLFHRLDSVEVEPTVKESARGTIARIFRRESDYRAGLPPLLRSFEGFFSFVPQACAWGYMPRLRRSRFSLATARRPMEFPPPPDRSEP
jgi:hypothetical protein